MIDLEALFRSVDCPVCRAPAGDACIFRVTVRGGTTGWKTHIGRQSRAIARERREQTNQSERTNP